MPEISETKDPEGVMLKCAKKNNLSIAQLEKLGHVFNTAKSLACFSKQANRGDSFTIVNVPAMCKKFASYTPGEDTAGSKKVRSQVDRLVSWANESKSATALEAQYWTERFNKKASSKNVPSLSNIISDMWKQSEGGAFYRDEGQGNQYIEFEPTYGRKPDITFDKTAGFIEDLHGMRKSAKEAVELYKQIKDEAILNVAADCKKIANAMYFHDTDWKDIAYDIHDGMPEKAAAVVNLVEAYFKKNRVNFTPAEIEKKAYVRAICRDQYGLMSTFKDIIENNEMYKDACEKLEILNRPKTPDQSEKMAALLDAMQSPETLTKSVKDLGISDKDKMERKQQNAQSTAARSAALQQLLMSDPVLSSADHAQVEDLFNTISNVSPDLAKDPNFIGPVLKEAIQYGSIPVQQLKDLLSVQLDANKIKVTNKQLESGKYNSTI